MKLNINESKVRRMIRKVLLESASSNDIKTAIKDIKSGFKALKNRDKKLLNKAFEAKGLTASSHKHVPNKETGDYAVLTLSLSTDKIIDTINAVKLKDKGFKNSLVTNIRKLDKAQTTFSNAGITSIHSGVRAEANVFLLMNAGLIGSSEIMDKAGSLEGKYKEVKANGKTIKRDKYGDTTILDPKFDKLKPAEKDQEGGVAVKKKKKGLSSSGKTKVKKIQNIIGAEEDGSWGPKTTTAWKAWIVSQETKKGIEKAGMDNVLTPQFLSDNKGKAATIAKKAGKTANLDGVLELAELIEYYNKQMRSSDEGSSAPGLQPDGTVIMNGKNYDDLADYLQSNESSSDEEKAAKEVAIATDPNVAQNLNVSSILRNAGVQPNEVVSDLFDFSPEKYLSQSSKGIKPDGSVSINGENFKSFEDYISQMPTKSKKAEAAKAVAVNTSPEVAQTLDYAALFSNTELPPSTLPVVRDLFDFSPEGLANKAKASLKETKIRRMIRQIVLENLRKA